MNNIIYLCAFWSRWPSLAMLDARPKLYRIRFACKVLTTYIEINAADKIVLNGYSFIIKYKIL